MEGMDTGATQDGAQAQSAGTSADTHETQADTGSAQFSKEEQTKTVGSKSQTQTQKQVSALRELADNDMDALVPLKVNGQVKKVPLREAIKYAQLGDSAYQKMQEAAALKKEVMGLQRLAKEDPDQFMSLMGFDPDQYSEARLLKKIEAATLTPEQKELMELKKYKEQTEKERREALEKQKRAQEEEEQSREMQSLDKEIAEAWAQSGLPRDPYYVQLIAATMLAADKRGEPLKASEAAAKVKSKWVSHNKTVHSQMDAKAIHEMYGDDFLEKIRKYIVDQASGNTTPQSQDTKAPRPGAKPASNKRQNNKPMNELEWRRYMDDQVTKLKSQG